MEESQGMHPLPVLIVVGISMVLGMAVGGPLGGGIAGVLGIAIFVMTYREVEQQTDE